MLLSKVVATRYTHTHVEWWHQHKVSEGKETEWLLVSPFKSQCVLVSLYCSHYARVCCVCLDVQLCVCVCVCVWGDAVIFAQDHGILSLSVCVPLQKSSHLSLLISREQLACSQGLTVGWHLPRSLCRHTHTHTHTHRDYTNTDTAK